MHLQKCWPLIVIARLAGLIALMVAIFHLLGTNRTGWQMDMCVGLGWLILANLDEQIARLRDMAEKEGVEKEASQDLG